MTSFDIERTRTLFSLIDSENADLIKADLLTHRAKSSTSAGGSKRKTPPSTRLLFLGVRTSPSVARLLSDLIDQGFGVTAFRPGEDLLVNPQDARGGTAIVDPSRWGVVALARAVDFVWTGQEADAAIFAGVHGADFGRLSAPGKDVDRLFSALPPVGSSTFCSALAEGVNLFLPTTVRSGKNIERARRDFSTWIERQNGKV